ncbi:DUF547 domain-containing protein [Pseudomonadota bacterium]
MIKHIFFSAMFITCALMAMSELAIAEDPVVPEPFQRFNASSDYTINYEDLSTFLAAMVIDTGRSNREKATSTSAKTGTRMKTNVNRLTVNEGNRFYFEAFEDDENIRHLLGNLQRSLEQIPTEVPLEYFSRDEQLAYWLNLYNFTVLNEITRIYPKRNLKKLLVGKNSILSNKLLTVAGIPLSLNDIQFTILKQNYKNNPLIMYGLYQGIIGGPNIRKRAYTGENVYRNLVDNAIEFVNSNRGTYIHKSKVFRVSSLYERNKAYFSDFNPDLAEHLLHYLEGAERGELQAATKVTADIDDWTVTDLYGTYHEIGGSLADNSAALIDSVSSSGMTNSFTSTGYLEKAGNKSRFSAQMIEQLEKLSRRNAVSNAEKVPEKAGAPDQVSDDPEKNKKKH